MRRLPKNDSAFPLATRVTNPQVRELSWKPDPGNEAVCIRNDERVDNALQAAIRP